MKRWMKSSVAVTSMVAAVPLIGATGPAAARPGAAAPRPSIKITGISLDRFNAEPGTKITYQPNNPPNACYEIGGADQSPPQVDVVFFIHAVGIPAGAPTTLKVTTPWDTQSRPEAGDLHPTFGKTWFPNKARGVAGIFGGDTRPGNFYTFDDEGTRGNAFNGSYAITTTVKVDGKVLTARATLKVDCVA